MQNYEDLTSFIQYLATLPKVGEGFALGPFKKLLHLLGNPEKKLRGVQVVGTNGKGSTAYLTQRILGNLGKKVGLYTSPHLMSHTERIRINDSLISKKDLLRYFMRVKKILETSFTTTERKPTFFEVITAIAWLYFLEQGCDYVVNEAGIGGKLDATTLGSWDVVVITNVTREHTAILGKTIKAIASDKAEAIWPKATVVTSTTGVAFDVVREKTKQGSGKLYRYGKDFSAKLTTVNWQGMEIEYVLGNQWGHAVSALLGEHQVVNCVDALQTAWIVAQATGVTWDVFTKAAQLAISTASWPGRFEQFIHHAPASLPNNTFERLILDGAHNIAGVDCLVALLSTLKKTGEKLTIIFGAMKDKPYGAMITKLATVADDFVFWDLHLTADHQAFGRILPAETLQKVGKGTVAHGASEVLEVTWQQYKGKGITCFCGSLYLLGEVRKEIVGAVTPVSSPDALINNPDFTRKP